LLGPDPPEILLGDSGSVISRTPTNKLGANHTRDRGNLSRPWRIAIWLIKWSSSLLWQSISPTSTRPVDDPTLKIAPGIAGSPNLQIGEQRVSTTTMFSSPTSQTPACHCLLKSPSDAIYILEAVRQGLLPRCSRRLTGNERSRIGPGSVWVWEEGEIGSFEPRGDGVEGGGGWLTHVLIQTEETNMRRWTDGRRWGASRVGAGGFLIYREVEGSGRGRHRWVSFPILAGL
jgi:hypothetical protein